MLAIEKPRWDEYHPEKDVAFQEFGFDDFVCKSFYLQKLYT